MKPLITCIIPNHNYGRFLNETLDSVLNQSYTNVEILVFDNGSSDESGDIIRSYGKAVKSIFSINVGQAKARNIAIEVAQGNIIALLDADDRWLPEKLDMQMELLNIDSGFVYSGYYKHFDNENKSDETCIPIYRGNCSEYFIEYPTRSIVPGGESSALFWKDLWLKVDGFNDKLSSASGRDFYRKISKLTDFDFVEKPLFVQRIHNSNMSKNLNKITADTALAYEILFKDPLWNLPESTKRKTMIALQYSFLKTYIKKFNILQTLKSISKILRLLIRN